MRDLVHHAENGSHSRMKCISTEGTLFHAAVKCSLHLLFAETARVHLLLIAIERWWSSSVWACCIFAIDVPTSNYVLSTFLSTFLSTLTSLVINYPRPPRFFRTVSVEKLGRGLGTRLVSLSWWFSRSHSNNWWPVTFYIIFSGTYFPVQRCCAGRLQSVIRTFRYVYL